jgi:hypothetical protein
MKRKLQRNVHWKSLEDSALQQQQIQANSRKSKSSAAMSIRSNDDCQVIKYLNKLNYTFLFMLHLCL